MIALRFLSQSFKHDLISIYTIVQESFLIIIIVKLYCYRKK